MAYTRLNLQDYKDKWTAAHVEHIEDGIVANTDQLNTLSSKVNSNSSNITAQNDSINDLNTSIDNLYENVDTLNQWGMAIGTTVSTPLWLTLLSEGGEKIYPPSISFDGNLTNKIIVPFPGFTTSMSPYEKEAFYVRIGEPLTVADGESSYVATLAGMPHLVIPLLFSGSINNLPIGDNASDTPMVLSESNMDITPEDIISSSTLGLAMQMASSSIENADGGIIPFFSSLYNSSISSSTELMTAIGQMFSAAANYPIGFVASNDFVTGDVTYPSGTYVLYTTTALTTLLNFSHAPYPWVYIDKIWNLNLLESPTSNNFTDIDSLDCNSNNSVLKAYDNIIYWDGVSGLEHCDNTNDMVLLSRNPWPLLKASERANSVSVKNSDGTLTGIGFEVPTYRHWDFIDVLDDSGNWYATIVLHAFYENNVLYQPGVYSYTSESPLIIVYDGISINDYIDKKIPYKHIPDVPTFDLTIMGMPMLVPGEPMVSCAVDATELCLAAEKGPIKIVGMTSFGEVTITGTATKWNSVYQVLAQAKFNGQRLELQVEFDNAGVQAQIEVLQ